MLTRLDHVLVLVDDLEVATRDTGLLLGRAPAWRGEDAASGTSHVLFPLENLVLELLTPRGEGAFAGPLRARLAAHGEGLLGLAFATDDADACARALRARGIAASDPAPGEGRPEGGDGRVLRWRNVFLPAQATRGLLLLATEHEAGPPPLPPAAPTAPPPAVVAGLDHVVIETSDLAAATALYRDGLGLRLALDRTFEARGLRILFFRLAGTTVEVVGSLEPPAAPEASDRLRGLAFRVADVAAARARLAEAGFEVSEARSGFKPGTRVCTVRAPTHGVATLLIGPDGLGG